LNPRPTHATPFPVEVPYRVRADLTLLTPDTDAEPHQGQPLPRGATDDVALHAKRTALQMHPQRVRVPDPQCDPRDVARTLAATLPTLALHRPDVLQASITANARTFTDAERRHWEFLQLDDEAHDLLASQPAPTRIADALALSLPEDFAWMRDDGREGSADLLHVTFPSHWAPETRAGASLLALHQPVADGDALRNASRNLMRAITRKGPFRRYVWSLNPTPNLDRHPATTPPAGTGTRHPIDDTWFRVERQTTLPFPDQAVALFTIRILVTPLRDVLTTEPGRAATLAAAIRSMGPELRRYKGLHDAEALLDTLDTFDPPSS